MFPANPCAILKYNHRLFDRNRWLNDLGSAICSNQAGWPSTKNVQEDWKMKLLGLCLVALFSVCSVAFAATGEEPNEVELATMKTIQSYVDAFNKGDASLGKEPAPTLLAQRPRPMAGGPARPQRPAMSHRPSAKPASRPATRPAVKPTKPTKPVAKPSKPATKPTKPVAKPSRPATKPAKPVAKPEKPGNKPVTKPPLKPGHKPVPGRPVARPPHQKPPHIPPRPVRPIVRPPHIPHHWWKWAAWGAVGGWIVGSRWSTPYYYGYGSNVYYDNGYVYIDGEQAATAQEYYDQAQKIASGGSAVDLSKEKEGDWLPLGVFGLYQGDSNDSNKVLQLAMNKQGVLSGTYYDLAENVERPVSGTVDQDTQRAAWTFADGKDTDIIMETGLANLTEEQAGALVHFGKDKTEQWLMVRQPEQKQGK